MSIVFTTLHYFKRIVTIITYSTIIDYWMIIRAPDDTSNFTRIKKLFECMMIIAAYEVRLSINSNAGGGNFSIHTPRRRHSRNRRAASFCSYSTDKLSFIFFLFYEVMLVLLIEILIIFFPFLV